MYALPVLSTWHRQLAHYMFIINLHFSELVKMLVNVYLTCLWVVWHCGKQYIESVWEHTVSMAFQEIRRLYLYARIMTVLRQPCLCIFCPLGDTRRHDGSLRILQTNAVFVSIRLPWPCSLNTIRNNTIIDKINLIYNSFHVCIKSHLCTRDVLKCTCLTIPTLENRTTQFNHDYN